MERQIDSGGVWRLLVRECGAGESIDEERLDEWLRYALSEGSGGLRWMPPYRAGFRLWYSKRDGLWVVPYPEYAPYPPERKAEADRVTALLQAMPGAW